MSEEFTPCRERLFTDWTILFDSGQEIVYRELERERLEILENGWVMATTALDDDNSHDVRYYPASAIIEIKAVRELCEPDHLWQDRLDNDDRNDPICVFCHNRQSAVRYAQAVTG